MNLPAAVQNYKIREIHLYSGITISSFLYACFIVSNQFYYRLGSILFVAIFLLTLGLFILERRKTFFKPNGVQARIWFFLFTFLTIIPLAYSIQGNLKDILTLIFHPYAFLAFFISIMALTVNPGTQKELLGFARIVNSLLPLAIIADLAILKQPAGINELHFFLFVEFLLFEQLKTGRKLYILILTVALIVIQILFDNRMVAIRLLVVSLGLLTFLVIPFLKNRVLRFTILSGSIVFIYLLSFHFEGTFQFFTTYLENISIDTTDTRTFLYTEFFDDFKGLQWLGGKGYMGSYFSQWFYEWQGDDGDHFQRFSIEIGALEILLKGGLLLLIPFYALVIGCLYLGFVQAPVRSIAFRFSFFLLVQFIITGIENRPAFSINYLLIWLSMGIILVETRYKPKLQEHVGNL